MTLRPAIFLLPFLIRAFGPADAAYGEAPTPRDISEARRIAGLIQETGQGRRLAGILRKLEVRPDSLPLRQQLHDTVSDVCEESRQRVASGGQADPLRDSCFSFQIWPVENEAVGSVCLDGHRASMEGRYLEAADRFGLCRILEPWEAWLKREVDEYLGNRIPRAVTATSRSLGSRAAKSYRSAYRSLSRSSWKPAASSLDRCAALLRGRSGRVRRRVRDECATLAVRVRKRVSAGIMDERVQGARRSIDSDPQRAIEELEAIILHASAESEESWWRLLGNDLWKAYSRRNLGSRLGASPRAYESGPVEQGEGPPEESFRQEPELFRESGERETGVWEEAEPRTQAPGEAGAPPQGSEQWWNALHAESRHNRGLKFYLQGKRRLAADEWRKALRMNPSQEKSRKALERVLKELRYTPR